MVLTPACFALPRPGYDETSKLSVRIDGAVRIRHVLSSVRFLFGEKSECIREILLILYISSVCVLAESIFD